MFVLANPALVAKAPFLLIIQKTPKLQVYLRRLSSQGLHEMFAQQDLACAFPAYFWALTTRTEARGPMHMNA